MEYVVCLCNSWQRGCVFVQQLAARSKVIKTKRLTKRKQLNRADDDVIVSMGTDLSANWI